MSRIQLTRGGKGAHVHVGHVDVVAERLKLEPFQDVLPICVQCQCRTWKEPPRDSKRHRCNGSHGMPS